MASLGPVGPKGPPYKNFINTIKEKMSLRTLNIALGLECLFWGFEQSP